MNKSFPLDSYESDEENAIKTPVLKQNMKAQKKAYNIMYGYDENGRPINLDSDTDLESELYNCYSKQSNKVICKTQI